MSSAWLDGFGFNLSELFLYRVIDQNLKVLQQKLKLWYIQL